MKTVETRSLKRVMLPSAGGFSLVALLATVAVAGLFLVRCDGEVGSRHGAPTLPKPAASNADASPDPASGEPPSHGDLLRVPEVAAQQTELTNSNVLDEAADDLLDDLAASLEEMVASGESRAQLMSFSSGVLDEWGGLMVSAQTAYLTERGTTAAVTLSVPCNECSDNYTDCISDAVDNLVDCLFGCGAFGGSCRRNCRATWRAEREACKEANRECRKTCTPK